MWTDEQQVLFDKISEANSNGKFEKALGLAGELLAQLDPASYQYAYVLGCRTAVALWHLNRVEESRDTFARARLIVANANEPAIQAYITSDMAQISTGDEAVELAHAAIGLCLPARTTTPDLKRNTIADIAYLQASQGRVFQRQGRFEEAKMCFRAALPTLKQYAHGSHPRYKDAYLMTLGWDFALRSPSSLRELLTYPWHWGVLVNEIRRQKKLLNRIKRLIWH